MKTGPTIACARERHNRRSHRPRAGRAIALPAALLAITAIGCTQPRVQLVEIPFARLANAQAAEPEVLGRTRVPFDRPLPNHLVQELSPEYSLVRITRPADWEEIRGRFDLPEPQAEVDFGQGVIIGILANVGEHAEPGWPIHLVSVRTESGVGWVEASFAPGLYYPLQTAAYLELAFVPGLQQVGLVRINSRLFVLGSAFHLD